MSDSDRGRDHKIRLAPWIVGALLISLIVVGIGGVQQAIYYENASRRAAGYTRQAEEQIDAECRVVDTHTQCARNIKQTARENQRDEYDLYSQETMAVWTTVLGVFGVLGVGMTPVGIYLVWTTFRETKRTADEARRSADAFIAAERGWLSLKFVERTRPDDNAPIVLRAFAELQGRSGVEIDALHWIALVKSKFPDRQATFETKELSRRIEMNDVGKSIHFASIEVPIGTKFIGGWLSYRVKFPGERRTYFIGKVIPKGHKVDPSGKTITTFGLRLRKDETWPENT